LVLASSFKKENDTNHNKSKNRNRNLAYLVDHYALCYLCLVRQGYSYLNLDSYSYFSDTQSSSRCFICRGLLSGFDALKESILEHINGRYEYETFLLGASMPSQIFEREDQIRARFKIKGKETIKSQITREIGLRLANLTKKRVEYIKPDLLINLVFDKENNISITTRSRPIVISGRYLKNERGIPQKQARCGYCQGTGCNSCDYSGLSGYFSVEGIIAKELLQRVKGECPRFLWVGSEDKNSLVNGKGRPFFVRINNPHIRSLNGIKILNLDGIIVQELMTLDCMPSSHIAFTTKINLTIECVDTISIQDIEKIRGLSGCSVCYYNKSKKNEKNIYKCDAEILDRNRARITITADGGLPVKQFVGGEEYMDPNVSSVIGKKCDCLYFDIMDLDVFD
jgi:tRNA pseudouridine synthase 10